MAILFLSHSTKNKADALRIQKALNDAGHTVFVDSDHEDGIAPASDWREELFTAVAACNAVVFLNSAESQGSHWCHTELAIATEHRKWIYAVNLTADVGPHPLLADKQGIRLETTFDDSLAWLGSTLAKDFAGRNATTAWDPTRGPYPGLRSFEAADAAVFFGRDEAVAQVIERIDDAALTTAGNLIALIGPSGSGKSSLVKAGVVPRLVDRGDTLIVGPFEPGNFPTDRLVASLNNAASANEAVSAPTFDATTLRADGLVRAIGRLLDANPDHRRSLLVIDQIEYLCSAEPGERDPFLNLIDAAIAGGTRITVLLVIRQDRLEDVQRLVPLGRRITSTLAVLPIDVDGLRSAIESPAAAARMVVDPQLTDKAINEATNNGTTDAGRALPLVAETLRAVYELAVSAGRRAMTAADYDAVGGVPGSLRRYAEQAESHLDANASVLDALLPRFVTLEDDSRPALGRPVALQSLDEGQRELVAKLQDVRLLTGDGDSVRIVHDRLIEAWPRLANVVQKRRKELLFRAQLERQAREWRKGDGTEFLLGTESTDEAEQVMRTEADSMSPDVLAYVKASRVQVDRARRRRNVIVSVLTVLAVGASSLAVWANASRNTAKRASDKAQAAARVAQAGDLAARSKSAADPYDAALLALEAQAWTPEPTLQARIAWRQALSRLDRQSFLASPTKFDTGTPATTVAWNPKQPTIAAGTDDGLVLLSATTGEVTATASTGSDSTTAIAWNQQGTMIAATNADGTLSLFEATDLADARTEPITVGDGTGDDEPRTLAWNPAGTIIAIGTSNDGLFLVSVGDEDLRPVGDRITTRSDRPVRGDQPQVNGKTRALAWSTDGAFLVTGNTDGALHVFTASGTPTGKSAFGSGVEALATRPDGRTVAEGTYFGTLRFFDITTGQVAAGPPVITGTGVTGAVVWSPDGTTVRTANSDGTVRVFDARTGKPQGDAILTGPPGRRSVAWDHKASAFVVATEDATLRLFDDAVRPASIARMETPTFTTSVGWNAPGSVLATGTFSDGIVLFDTANGRKIGSIDRSGTTGWQAVSWNPSGSVLAAASDDGTVQRFDALTRRPIGKALKDPSGAGARLAWNPTGTTLAVAQGPLLRLVSGDSPVSIKVELSESAEIGSVAWSPDGSTIAVGDTEGIVRFYDPTGRRSGEPITSADDEALSPALAAWSPDGSVLAVATSGDGAVRFFDGASRKPAGTPIVTEKRGLWTLGWNPSGSVLAVKTGSTIRLFDPLTRQEIGDPITTDASVTAEFAWNTAGTAIASTLYDGSPHLFYAWPETSGCAYLRRLMTTEKMDALVGIKGARSTCAHGKLRDLPPLPVLTRPLP